MGRTPQGPRCCAAGAGGRRSAGCARERGREALAGPLAEGLDVPRDLDLGDRARAPEQLKVHPAAHSQTVSTVMVILPEREAGLLVGSRRWPLPAARTQNIHESDTVALQAAPGRGAGRGR